MIPITQLYSGTNAGSVVPKFEQTDEALRSYTRKVEDISSQMLKKSQEDRARLLDYSNIKPIMAISKKLQADQADKIAGLQNELKRVSRKPFKSTADFLDIQDKLNALSAWQDNIQASQALYGKALWEMKDKPGQYDQEAFNEEERKMMDTGMFDVGNALIKNPQNLIKRINDIPERNGWKYRTEQWVSGTTINEAGDKVNLYSTRKIYTNDDGSDMTQAQMDAKMANDIESDPEMSYDVTKTIGKLIKNNDKPAEDYFNGYTGDINPISGLAVQRFSNQRANVKTTEGNRIRGGSDFTVNYNNGVFSDGKKTYLSQGVANGFYNKGDGAWIFNQSTTKPFDIASADLKVDDGYVLPDRVTVKAVNIKDGKVEFSVKQDAENSVKKYLMENGQRKVFTQYQAGKAAKGSMRMEPTGKDDASFGGHSSPGYYVYDLPASLPAVGSLDLYADEVAKNATQNEIDVNKLIEVAKSAPSTYTTEQENGIKRVMDAYKWTRDKAIAELQKAGKL